MTHPTVDKLHPLRCAGMAKALTEQLASHEVRNLTFEACPRVPSGERLGLLVDRELTERHSRQLTHRLRRAKLRHAACFEDIDFRQPRGLDKALVLSLADGRRVREHLNVLITGPTGIGKSWMACALAHSACRHAHSASYRRLPRLLGELAIARADGSYPRRLASLAKTEVLVIDDFGLAKLTAATCSKSSRTAMASARPCSPASSPSRSGTTPSPTRPWPTPSSTASCTAPTHST